MQTIAGILTVNKPSGVTSFSIVHKIKKALNIKKVGHCGTLDPLAEGVLVIVYGSATRLQDGLMQGKKTYRARVRLGMSTETGDTDGKITAEKPVPSLDDARLQEVLGRYVGEIVQVPPMYSALKVNGRKLYELARRGITVERQPRKITIESIDLLSVTERSIELRVVCSRGTYIRTLAEDIGRDLGCGGCVEYLCREQVGRFTLDNALTSAAIEASTRQELLDRGAQGFQENAAQTLPG